MYSFANFEMLISNINVKIKIRIYDMNFVVRKKISIYFKKKFFARTIFFKLSPEQDNIIIIVHQQNDMCIMQL